MILRDEQRTLPVRPPPPKGGVQKRKMPIAVFRQIVHFTWRKSATKFFLCKYCSRQSCKAFAIYSAKIVRGGRPLQLFYVKMWSKLAHPFKTPISNQYLLVALEP